MTKHYRRSPSAAKRQNACPGSLALSEGVPRKESVYAAEGTAAHALGERLLRGEEMPADVDPELRTAITSYVDFVNGLRSTYEVLAEGIEVTMEYQGDIEEFGGTSDLHMIYRDNGKVVLHVVDYKHGVGVPVEAFENQQGLSYFLIIESHYPGMIDEFRFTIVQPRTFSGNPVDTWSCSRESIQSFKALIKSNEGRTDLVAGDHCRWCPAITVCPEVEARAKEIAEQEFTDIMDSERIATYLGLDTAIRSFLDAMWEKAMDRIKEGKSVEGYKVVEKMSHRRWVYEDQAMTLKVLKKLGISKSLATKTELKSPAQLEKELSKEQKASIQKVCKAFPIGYNVVPNSGRGESIDFSVSEFDSVEVV